MLLVIVILVYELLTACAHQDCDASRGGLKLFPTEEQVVDNSTVYVMSTLPNLMQDANPPRPQPVRD
jgi:hypothetical protein